MCLCGQQARLGVAGGEGVAAGSLGGGKWMWLCGWFVMVFAGAGNGNNGRDGMIHDNLANRPRPFPLSTVYFRH